MTDENYRKEKAFANKFAIPSFISIRHGFWFGVSLSMESWPGRQDGMVRGRLQQGWWITSYLDCSDDKERVQSPGTVLSSYEMKDQLLHFFLISQDENHREIRNNWCNHLATLQHFSVDTKLKILFHFLNLLTSWSDISNWRDSIHKLRYCIDSCKINCMLGYFRTV